MAIEDMTHGDLVDRVRRDLWLIEMQERIINNLRNDVGQLRAVAIAVMA